MDTPMPYYRKLPSGLWQATVRDPSGRRHSHTDKLKSAVKAWATAEEDRYNRGDTRDPAEEGKIPVGTFRKEWMEGRVVDNPTVKKNNSLWRVHCEPRWGDWPMGSVTRKATQAWVRDLMETRRQRHKGRPVEGAANETIPLLSAATIQDIVHHMSALYKAAMKQDPPVVSKNPFADLELPKRAARAVLFYEPEEEEAIYESVALRPHGHVYEPMVRLGMQVGLRPGELFGLHGHRVDWLRGLIHVTHVMTEEGIREYPKSMKSSRTVPVEADVLDLMRPLMAGRPVDAPVFTAPEGGLILDDTFRHRIWYPAVEDARMCTEDCRGACQDPAHRVRRFPPRVMRSTAASRLAQDDVDLKEIQDLLGHEDYATTLLYAALKPGAHKGVRASWERRKKARVEEQGA